MIDKAVLNL